jgi:Domain of unknown function (DUF4276)
MNIFILVEGKTERKIYPKWLEQLLPNLTKVERPDLVNQNNYCIINSNGYPSILGFLKETIAEANRLEKFDFFVVIADTDDKTINEREQEIRDFLIKEDIKLNNSTDFIIILQRCCIETWFLGNRSISTENPISLTLKNWIEHFNVSINDPELMPLPTGLNKSIGAFHKMYYGEMRDEYFRNKESKDISTESNHLINIIERFEQTGHIQTFGKFLNFCKKLNSFEGNN